MKYRSKNEILVELLEAASAGPIAKTRFMQDGHLSFQQLNIYFPYLMSNELIVESESGRYSLSPKGLVLLKALKSAQDLMPELHA